MRKEAKIIMSDVIRRDSRGRKLWTGEETRKIADEAGVSSGLMFHYFSNKISLYEALVEIGCEKLTIKNGENELPIAFFEKYLMFWCYLLDRD